MDFSLSSDQLLIKESVDRFVGDAYGPERRRAIVAGDHGFSRDHWRTFASLGWLGIALPESQGGFGGSPVESMILMEAFGRGLVVEPYLPTVVLGGNALAFGGAHGDLLEQMIEGELLLSLAYAEDGSRYDEGLVETRARRDGDDLVIDGKKRGVLFGAVADKLVVSVRTRGLSQDRHGITLVLVDGDAPGVRRRDYRTVDGGRASDVVFSGVRVGPQAIVGELDGGLAILERTLDYGIAALAAEAVGIMSVMHATTVDYLKARTQFGVPIGSFQVLQHRAVDMLMSLEMARSMCYYGTMALSSSESDPQRRRALSATKVQIARSGRYVGQQAIQLHGAIGMTEEYHVGHYFKRMSMIELALGDVDHHLRRYVALGRIEDRAERPPDVAPPVAAESFA